MDHSRTGGRSLAERFQEKIKVNPDTGCWEWTGYRDPAGYGRIRRGGTVAYVHRVAREIHRGPIPAGLQLDHLCRVRHCANPDHLEPVTARENILRGEGQAAVNAAKTHCAQGHALSGENLYIHPGRGFRLCRACRRARNAAAYKARKIAQTTESVK